MEPRLENEIIVVQLCLELRSHLFWQVELSNRKSFGKIIFTGGKNYFPGEKIILSGGKII